MPLIIEDGTSVPDANSFASRAQIIAYGALRGIEFVDDGTTDVTAIKAMDYIVSQPCFKGDPVYADQALPFPRYNVTFEDNNNGIPLPPPYVYGIPNNLIRAQCQLCCDISNGIDVMPSRSADLLVKKEVIGPLSTEYFAGDETPLVWLPIANAALSPLLCGDGGSFRVETYRK